MITSEQLATEVKSKCLQSLTQVNTTHAQVAQQMYDLVIHRLEGRKIIKAHPCNDPATFHSP